MLTGTEIKEKIPHRYPFLLLDRVLELDEQRAVGQKNVTVNEPYFRGHFPNAPVMPGVLVLESLLQLAWVLFSSRGPIKLERIRRLKFRKPVVPGDSLQLEVQRIAEQDGLEKFRGVAKLEGKVAVEGDFWVRVLDSGQKATVAQQDSPKS